MRQPIYNSAIPGILRSVHRSWRGCVLRIIRLGTFCVLGLACATASAADWGSAEKQLAQKIAAVTGPGAAALSVQNRSSLGKRDADIVQNGIQSALDEAGVRLVSAEQAAASIELSLSENETSYVWVAEIRQGSADRAVVMVSVPRPAGAVRTPDSMPMTLRKTLLWSANDPILDLAVLEENGTPARMAVLSPDALSFYRMQSGKWQAEQKLAISHSKPWPLDLRGRLLPIREHGFEIFLPGVLCQTASTTMTCREGDDPWPLTPGLSGMPALAAFYAPRRNFFTGVISPSIGKFSAVPKFFSAAFLPREKYVLWLFAATDGQMHLVDGIRDQALISDWGSDITTVRTPCGAGWQVLATKSGESGESVRAYELPDRDPIAVTAAVDFSGSMSALWTENGGDSAIAIARHPETGTYEAYRLAVACNQ